MDAKGEAILVLIPAQEQAMFRMLQEKKILITKIRFAFHHCHYENSLDSSWIFLLSQPSHNKLRLWGFHFSVNEKQIIDISRRLQSVITQYPGMKEFAQRVFLFQCFSWLYYFWKGYYKIFQSFVAYIRTIYLMQNKEIFNLNTVDMSALAKYWLLIVVLPLVFLQVWLFCSANFFVLFIDLTDLLRHRGLDFWTELQTDRETCTQVQIPSKKEKKVLKNWWKWWFQQQREGKKRFFFSCLS